MCFLYCVTLIHLLTISSPEVIHIYSKTALNCDSFKKCTMHEYKDLYKTFYLISLVDSNFSLPQWIWLTCLWQWRSLNVRGWRVRMTSWWTSWRWSTPWPPCTRCRHGPTTSSSTCRCVWTSCSTGCSMSTMCEWNEFVACKISISREHLKRCSMSWQMWESMLHQTLHVCVASTK